LYQYDRYSSKEMVAHMEAIQHPLDSITKHKDINPAEASVPVGYTDSESNDQQLEQDQNGAMLPEAVSIPRNISLKSIQLPAMVLDTQLRVVWQNKLAVDLIWHNGPTAKNGNPTPLIFDLIFDRQFQQMVDNWRHWASFFLEQAADILPESALHSRIEQINHKQKEILCTLAARLESHSGKRFNSTRRLRQLLINGQVRLYGVAAIAFNEGRLIIFEPESVDEGARPISRTHEIEQRLTYIRQHPNPIKVFHSILCASVNNWATLKTEMLSSDYCRLINELCGRCIDGIENHGGVFSKDSDSGFSAFFLPIDAQDGNSPENVLRCALALKETISDLSREWKIRKAWLHEIELNIGIHFEKEYVGILTTSVGENLTSFGNALRIASDLSRLALNGQIWATKALINDLPSAVRNHLRFGVQRSDLLHRQVLVESSFSRIQDLPEFANLPGNFFEVTGPVTATQVFDLDTA
jgi:adenylate cyclase